MPATPRGKLRPMESADGTPRVRPARAGDLDTLVEFNRAMALETEARELDADRLRSGVGRALADGERGSYRVAELDGRVVGCLLVTREWSDWRDGWFWWIQSVYVHPAGRRRGVYRALYADLEAEARGRGDVCGIRLYVEENNRAAQSVYGSLGMERTRYLLYEVDFTAPGPPEARGRDETPLGPQARGGRGRSSPGATTDPRAEPHSRGRRP